MASGIFRQRHRGCCDRGTGGGNGGIVARADYWPNCASFGTELHAPDRGRTPRGTAPAAFSTSHWNVVPDIVTVAGALGTVSIAAYLYNGRTRGEVHRLGAATFGGNPWSCRRSPRSGSIRNTDSASRSATGRAPPGTAWRRVQHGRGVIGDVRGLGLMIAAELNAGPELPRSPTPYWNG